MNTTLIKLTDRTNKKILINMANVTNVYHNDGVTRIEFNFSVFDLWAHNEVKETLEEIQELLK